MSRPDLPAGVSSAVALAHVERFPLIKAEFDVADGGTVYICGLDSNVTYEGNVYLASRGLISMESIVETGDEVAGIRFTLSGVTAALRAEALLVAYQGRPCTVMWAFLENGVLVVDELTWQGRLDVPSINFTKGSCTITVTAEHRMADWARPRQLLFNDADQRRIDATDEFFVGVEAMKEKTINLFSKAVLLEAGRG